MCMAMKALTQRVQLLQLSRFRRHSSGTLPFVFLLIVVVTACDLGAAPSCDLGFGSGGGSGIGPAFDGIEAAGEGAAGASEGVAGAGEGVAGAGEVVGGVAVDGSEVVGEVAVDAGEVVGEFIEQIESVGSSVWYEVEDSAVRVSWDLVDGADYYKVYYSDFIDSFCTLSRDGSPSFCKELAGNVAGTTYVHANPASARNYYWVVACNRGGCSDIDSGNPAALIETGPAGPANVGYGVEDSAVRVSWDLVDGADYYKVYYSDFVDSFCTLSRDGSPSFCKELAGNVAGTTYVHADPDSDKNYYWVVACNRGGCSDINSNSPAEDASLSTTAPTAIPSPEQPRPPTVVPAATPTPTPTESDMARRSFEASTPSGYIRVSLTDKEKVWGIPERFTSDSSLGAVAYMLLGSVKGCSFADEELDRSSIVYAKGERLGLLSQYESQEVCRMVSSTWDSGWDGIRITHLRIFDESSPTNAMEYVYDPDGMQYIESPGASGSN